LSDTNFERNSSGLAHDTRRLLPICSKLLRKLITD